MTEPDNLDSPSATPRPPILAASSDQRAESPKPPQPSPPPTTRTHSLGLPTALKPVGIFNDKNTCFLNSTFQALAATSPLISLLAANPAAPLYPVPTSLLPAARRDAALIPALHPSADEYAQLLPVTRAFQMMLRRAWTMKDAGGGTKGGEEENSNRSMSARPLLREIARKYEQYDDFRQQDAHELLRHLLDSMEMEEKDVIKQLQPPKEPGVPADVAEEERLVPFVDVLFGGMLASVVVCETCKSVSHTYEGFLDISLSLKGDLPRTRKRDRLRAIASRFKPRSTSGKGSADTAIASDPEGSDHEPEDRARRGSLDAASVASTHRSKTLGVRPRPSFSFRRKKDSGRPSSSGSGAAVESAQSSSSSLPLTGPAPRVEPTTPHGAHGRGPTAAQAAYIQRILSGPPGPPESADPLAKLRAAHNGAEPKAADYGLIDSLKAFTAVEVLEGDNAFACHKCWRIKSGRYDQHPAQVLEKDEDDSAAPASPSVASTSSRVPPSISIDDTDAASDDADSRLGRAGSIASTANGHARATSPLRRTVEFDESNNSIELASVSSYDTAPRRIPESTGMRDASDGLSDTSSDEDEARPGPPARPRLNRTKSKHFVLRRAFKRYLIAKAPEVLVFHIKRFKQTSKSVMAFSAFDTLKKIDDPLSFPEQLDLAPFLAPRRADFKVVDTPDGPHAPFMDWPSPEQGPEVDPIMYRLYAVVVHLGNMLYGHYIAYCLVDPQQMFGPAAEAGDVEATKTLAELSVGERKDRRVWCHCSE